MDKDSNTDAYGAIAPADVVMGGKGSMPAGATAFINTLGAGVRATTGTTAPATTDAPVLTSLVETPGPKGPGLHYALSKSRVQKTSASYELDRVGRVLWDPPNLPITHSCRTATISSRESPRPLRLPFSRIRRGRPDARAHLPVESSVRRERDVSRRIGARTDRGRLSADPAYQRAFDASSTLVEEIDLAEAIRSRAASGCLRRACTRTAGHSAAPCRTRP